MRGTLTVFPTAELGGFKISTGARQRGVVGQVTRRSAVNKQDYTLQLRLNATRELQYPQALLTWGNKECTSEMLGL